MLMSRLLLICPALCAMFPGWVQAQQTPTPATPTRPLFVIPEDVSQRRVNVFSEGDRVTGYLYTLKATPANAKLPTIIMAHGWGGVQAQLRQDASEFARE